MKIWLIAENWPPRIGGVETYLTHVAQYLGDQGHEVVVFVPKVGGRETASTFPKVTVIRRQLLWRFVRPKWLPFFLYISRKARRDRPSVVLCGKGLFEGLVGYYLYRQLRIPYVVFTYAMEVNTWLASPRTARQLQRVLPAAHRVVIISEPIKERLLQVGVTPEQIVKIPPGVDEHFLDPVSSIEIESVLEHYKIAQPYVLSVGRLIARKGFDMLLEAFAQLDQLKYGQVQLVIVGEGPDRQRLNELIDQNYLGKSVRLLGAVADADLPALYAGSEIFAMTPRDIAGDIEGYGIVYLEASALGKAILATRAGGVAEAVLDQKTGILVNPEVADIARGLQQLLSNEDWRRQLGQAGAQFVQATGRWKQRLPLLVEQFQPE